MREVGILTETVSAVQSRMHNLWSGDKQLKQWFKDNNMCFTAFKFEPKKFMNHKVGYFNDYK